MPDLAAGGPVRTLLQDYDFSKFSSSLNLVLTFSQFPSVYTSDCCLTADLLQNYISRQMKSISSKLFGFFAQLIPTNALVQVLVRWIVKSRRCISSNFDLGIERGVRSAREKLNRGVRRMTWGAFLTQRLKKQPIGLLNVNAQLTVLTCQLLKKEMMFNPSKMI